MKQFATLFFVVIFTQVNAQHLCEYKAHNFAQASAQRSTAEEDSMSQYDVKYHKLEISLTDASSYISKAKVTTKAQVVSGPFSNFVFELSYVLTVDSVLINGVLCPHNFSSDIHTVNLPAALNPGDFFTAEIFYHGQPLYTAGGDGLGHSTYSGIGVTWSMSEPFAAKLWWPCKQVLTDKIDSLDVLVTIPTGLKAGSNGVLIDTFSAPGNKTVFHWQLRHPIDYYLVSVAVADYYDYSIYANPVGAAHPVLIQNYLYNNTAYLNAARPQFDTTRALVEYFSTLFGTYPFADAKYGHCVVPAGGGMENETMTTLGNFSTNDLFWVIAHELAHQWFGDNVTCGSWTDIWLNEGFASYCEYLAWQRFKPGAARSDLDSRNNYVINSNIGTTYCSDTLSETRIFDYYLTYMKGSLLVHMLRFETNNDSLFFSILRQYQQLYRNGNGYSANLKHLFEQGTGKDLTPFFDQWFYGQGYPTIIAAYNTSGDTAILKLSETASYPSATPFFKTPVEVTFHGTRDTTVRVNIDSDNQQYQFVFNQPITGIAAIDTNQWIINREQINGLDTSLHVIYYVDTTHIDTTGTDTTTGMLRLQTDATFNIIPNPSTGILQITTTGKPGNTIRFFDITGAKVFEPAFAKQLDISFLQSGMYLVELEIGGQKIIRRLFKL